MRRVRKKTTVASPSCGKRVLAKKGGPPSRLRAIRGTGIFGSRRRGEKKRKGKALKKVQGVCVQKSRGEAKVVPADVKKKIRSTEEKGIEKGKQYGQGLHFGTSSGLLS